MVMPRSIHLAGLLWATAALGGCAMQAPKAWERELHARPAMSLSGDTLDSRLSAHIYTSKENSSGGQGVGGGGCGCN
jgi:hypothetical protein